MTMDNEELRRDKGAEIFSFPLPSSLFPGIFGLFQS